MSCLRKDSPLGEVGACGAPSSMPWSVGGWGGVAFRVLLRVWPTLRRAVKQALSNASSTALCIRTLGKES